MELQFNEREYYVKRENESRRFAAQATDPAVRAIHLAFAEKYAEMAARAAESRKPPSP